ncbi:hypothetical protein C1645_838331 [Glomus cerebriforme]|uniref:Uncharacterized protein n=1 Tax=Glomus cerebriforme TaxID=658196 RepID=A0A397SE22_9GLOM|nr:hypothetical protein C1645_838331 [Glomus cerebriforme]
MRKNIPLTLVDLLQPTIFEPITEEPHITNNTVITNMLESIGKGGQCHITDILNYILPLYIEQGILTPGTSTLYIRISGDRRNVGCKVKHIMVTMTLLNDLNGLQKPDNNYTLVTLFLYPEAESYESHKNSLTPLISDLSILKKKDLINKDEINTTTKTINKSMDEIKDNYNQIDEIWKEKILLEMQRLKITFQFWHEKNSNNLSYTSLMGPEKLKILREFNLIAIFQSTERAIQIQELWINLMNSPSKGHPNRSNFVREMYQIQDITPYIHVLVNHVAEFIEIHHNQNTLKDGKNETS